MATRPDSSRYNAQLTDALQALPDDAGDGNAAIMDAALRSAIRAVFAGRQQKKNLEPIMATARKAFVRALRRRARTA